MAINDVWVVRVNQTVAQGMIQNSLAFIQTIAGDPITSEFTNLVNDIASLHRQYQITTLTYTTWQARQVRAAGVVYPTGALCNPVGGRVLEGNFTGGTVGTDSGPGLPPQCAMVTTIKTDQIGRRRRGRFYAGGWTESVQTDGTWSSTVLTNVETTWQGFFTEHAVALPTDGFRLGIWSVRTATGCGPDPVTGEHKRLDAPSPDTAFTPAVSFVVRPTVYTQRRRVAGVGR